jgi:hypothetical protein
VTNENYKMYGGFQVPLDMYLEHEYLFICFVATTVKVENGKLVLKRHDTKKDIWFEDTNLDESFLGIMHGLFQQKPSNLNLKEFFLNKAISALYGRGETKLLARSYRLHQLHVFKSELHPQDLEGLVKQMRKNGLEDLFTLD